jgi:hypothetical protein
LAAKKGGSLAVQKAEHLADWTVTYWAVKSAGKLVDWRVVTKAVH